MRPGAERGVERGVPAQVERGAIEHGSRHPQREPPLALRGRGELRDPIGPGSQDVVRTGITTWTYWSSPIGLEDARRERPVELERELLGVDVLRTSARYRALNAIVVPSPSTAASTWPTWSPTSALALTVIPASPSPPIWSLTMFADSWAMSAAGRTARRSSSRSRTARVAWAWRQDLLVVRELAVDQPADEVDALEVEQDLVARRRRARRRPGRRCRPRTRASSLRARAGMTTLVSSTGSRIGIVLTAIR